MTVQVVFGRAADTPDPADLAVLDDAERARAERFVMATLTAHYAGAHAGVRRVLGARLDVPPEAIRFGRVPCPRCGSDEHGAPRVEWPPGAPHISLSHSEADWMLALSDTRVVGADLEGARRLDVEGVGRHVFTPAERELAAATDPDGLGHLLLTCWVRKEAVLKAVGVGLYVSLAAVEAQPRTPGPVRIDVDLPFERSSWWLHDVRTGPGTYAAVAVAAGTADTDPPAVGVTA